MSPALPCCTIRLRFGEIGKDIFFANHRQVGRKLGGRCIHDFKLAK